jgi:YidC/Oxa1 family membrane protein insertase
VKFDKTTIVVVVACTALVLGWTPLCKYMGWISYESAPSAAPPIVATTPPVIEKNVPANSEKTVSPLPVVSENGVKLTVKKYDDITIGNNDLTLTINPHDGVIAGIKLNNYLKNDKTEAISISDNIPPGAFSVSSAMPWEILSVHPEKVSPSVLALTRVMTQNGQRFELKQLWELKSDFQTACTVSLRNLSSTPLNFSKVKVMTNSLEPMRYLAGDDTRTEVFGIDYLAGKFKSIDATAKDESFHENIDYPVSWVGVTNKYFACVMKPEGAFDGGLEPFRKNTQINPKEEYYTVAVAGVFSDFQLIAGEVKKFKLNYYSGPKELKALADFDPSTQQIMHLSMFSPMEWISRQLLRFLVWLKSICGSWGWSIIILTVIVRAAFWPITQKANRSMKNMQKLQPLIKELKEKYKDNQQMMNTKMMELYKIHKVNPLGGCLPILLQIPVFIALYSTIDSSVELRHSSFWWAHDLAQPDTVATVLGIAINPLVLAMTLLMLVQQRLTPAAADPMQQKMMMIMPLVMLFFLYNLPSGLTLYWTVSQIISIIQLLINQKLNKDDTAEPAKTASTAKTS